MRANLKNNKQFLVKKIYEGMITKKPHKVSRWYCNRAIILLRPDPPTGAINPYIKI